MGTIAGRALRAEGRVVDTEFTGRRIHHALRSGPLRGPAARRQDSLGETPMWAMIVKEFRQLRRDRRTLAMMIVMPVILLLVFGYAASFEVSRISTVVGRRAGEAALPASFDVVRREPAEGASWARRQMRDGQAAVAVVTGTGT